MVESWFMKVSIMFLIIIFFLDSVFFSRFCLQIIFLRFLVVLVSEVLLSGLVIRFCMVLIWFDSQEFCFSSLLMFFSSSWNRCISNFCCWVMLLVLSLIWKFSCLMWVMILFIVCLENVILRFWLLLCDLLVSFGVVESSEGRLKIRMWVSILCSIFFLMLLWMNCCFRLIGISLLCGMVGLVGMMGWFCQLVLVNLISWCLNLVQLLFLWVCIRCVFSNLFFFGWCESLVVKVFSIDLVVMLGMFFWIFLQVM